MLVDERDVGLGDRQVLCHPLADATKQLLVLLKPLKNSLLLRLKRLHIQQDLRTHLVHLGLLLQSLHRLGHLFQRRLYLDTGLIELLHELLGVTVLLDPVRVRDRCIRPRQKLELPEQRLHSLLIERDALRVHELKHLRHMLDLHRDITVLRRWPPVAYEMLDEMGALVQAVELDQRRHVLLRSVHDEVYLGLLSGLRRSLLQLLNDLNDVE